MRILIWNIQFFTNNRVIGQQGANPAETLANQQSAQANLNLITSTVAEADADIFVILETLSSQGNLGTLGTGNGPDGLLTVLAALQQVNAAWRVVPPLRCNPREILDGHTYTESVGVFWRSDRLNFTGPWVWPGGNGPSAPNAVPAAYPDPWAAACGNVTAAAQCIFHRDNGEELTFPNPLSRRPYLTTFNDGNRTLKLFSVHTKPGTDAQTATARMLAIDPAVWTPADNEVSVFAGDFNLNLLALTPLEQAALALFTWEDFSLRQIHQPRPSRYLRRAEAQPNAYHTNEIFDYAFVRYGQNARPNPVLPGLVVDRVSGMNTQNGLPDFTTDMNQSLANISNLQTTFNIEQPGAYRNVLDGRVIVLFATTEQHGLVPMEWVLADNVVDQTFNDYYQVAAVLDANRFIGLPHYGQFGPANSGGGTITAVTRIEDVFRAMPNFGHIGPPAYQIGTSDHLPIFLIV